MLSKATKTATRDVKISAILIHSRLRALRPELVGELAESMALSGLISPIVITHPNGQAMPVLVAGRHRLEAAKQLNWDTIACLDLSWVDANKTLLIEIDENLVRGDLSQADRGAHTGKRKDMLETLGLALKHGGAPGAKGKGRGKAIKDANLASLSSFVKETAAKTGKSQRTVARDVARGRNTFPAWRRSLALHWTKAPSLML